MLKSRVHITLGLAGTGLISLALVSCAGRSPAAAPPSAPIASISISPVESSTPAMTPSASPMAPDVAAAVATFANYAENESTGGTVSISYVITSAGAAEAQFYGSQEHSTEHDTEKVPVVAMVASGTFDGSDEKVPSGATRTPGTYMSRIVNLSTGKVLDWGLGDLDPGLAKLGVPTVASAQ